MTFILHNSLVMIILVFTLKLRVAYLIYYGKIEFLRILNFKGVLSHNFCAVRDFYIAMYMMGFKSYLHDYRYMQETLD